MKDNTQRLDIRRCSDEGVERLVLAILLQSIRDWKVYMNKINKKLGDESDIYELKQIINFIQSDYFRCLTDDRCPQKECVDKLIDSILDIKVKEELNRYALKNRLRDKSK